MAQPQVENGFTRIANELLGALVKANLNGREFRIMLAIIRLTYGWNMKARKLSYQEVAAVAGVGRADTRKIMLDLRKRDYLWWQHIKDLSPYIWGIQKDYTRWNCGQIGVDSPPSNCNEGVLTPTTGGVQTPIDRGRLTPISAPLRRMATDFASLLKKVKK